MNPFSYTAKEFTALDTTHQIEAILTFVAQKKVSAASSIPAALESRNSGVRWAAVCDLGKLLDFTSVLLVLAALQDDSFWVRAAAVWTLFELSVNDPEIFFPLLNDPL